MKRELTSEELPHSDRPAARARNRRLRSGVIALILAAAGALAPAAAQAVAPLHWSTPPQTIDPGQSLSAIACPSENLCVAVDRDGQVLHTTSSPASPGPTWSSPHEIDQGHALTALSCASEQNTLCVAVNETGAVVASTNPNPTAGGAGTWQRTSIDSQPLTGVSCPSTKLCVAVNQAGHALVSTNAGASNPTWTATDIDGSNRLRSVACPSESLCVAVNAMGKLFTSTNPGAANWQARAIDAMGELVAVSCGSAGLCVAVNSAGNGLASADPGASAPTWSETQIDPTAMPTGISCASSGLCVSVNELGVARASDDPASGLPEWRESGADSGETTTSISCLPDGVCMAVDGAGRVVRATVEVPLVSTGSATEITPSEATLTATVNPSDAVLSLCLFEYGTTTGYGQTVPCAPAPSATGGLQTVQARISGLAAATAYHFRIVAANADGTNYGADATFTTTPAVSIVYPNPYILGVPANGVRLYCETGTSGSATFTYAWIRDATVIAGATSSSYVVSSATDAQHHLQCRVTASNAAGSASASSGFVAVPAMGVLAAAGETKVGKLSASATAIAIPLSCSTQAPAGCAIAVRATTRQSRTSGKGKHARRVTVTLTLAGATVHLKRGERRTLTLPLSAADRRLLARAHRLSATVSVTGTVIGELKATLANAALTLHDPPARGHAARQRGSRKRAQ